MKEIISREIQLRNRPVGIPSASNFEIARVPVRKPKDGEVLVQNEYISVATIVNEIVKSASITALAIIATYFLLTYSEKKFLLSRYKLF